MAKIVFSMAASHTPMLTLEGKRWSERAADDLKNKADTVAANGTNPDVADSDGDTWLDGHELNNGGNPSNPSVICTQNAAKRPATTTSSQNRLMTSW